MAVPPGEQMRTISSALAPPLAALLLCSAACAASPQATFARHGLFGTWAVDCTRPVSPANTYVVYRPLGVDSVQKLESIVPGVTSDVGAAEAMVDAATDELLITWRTVQEGRIINRVRLRPGRMQLFESTRDNGEKLSADGRRVRDNSENPWFNKCGVETSWLRPHTPLGAFTSG
jgi:hypothetical protein